ncbi:MAG: hypothetical protein KAY24_00480 [Candidatus Eisenbacteria sp.]|nr:hypothetical protein [Candidatus Eisenbacteria bacterium]
MRGGQSARLTVLMLLATSTAWATSGNAGEAWEVIGPLEVLASCRPGASGPLFTDSRGFQWPLIMAPHDAAIPNCGAGSFKPAPEAWVREALEMMDPRVKALVHCRVFILPFPRRGLLRSSCDGQAIYISPGVRPLTRGIVHFLIFHEIGHLIQRRLLPDWDGAGWQRYRKIRGITDSRVFSAEARHADRPHEIFAEDFRLLYGSPWARSVQPLEISLAPPLESLDSVRDFLEALLSYPVGKPHQG